MNKNEALDRIVLEAGRGELVFPTNMSASIRLNEILGDPDCHLEAVAGMVMAEPLIAARLVAIANSVAYTRFGAHVSNIRKAVGLLGLKPLRSLAAAIVVRQIGSGIVDAGLRKKADQLWRHCANVAALAKVIAREFTAVDPETALFAGIVHEIDGFYLLSRAQEFPELLTEETDAPEAARVRLAHGILQTLKVPRPIAAAVEFTYNGSPALPPTTLSDVLALANVLAATPSSLPVNAASAGVQSAGPGIPEFPIGEKTLSGALAESAAEIRAMTEALLVE